MRLTSLFILYAVVCLNATDLLAGHGYEVTSTDGKTTKTYMVRFGGGKAMDMATAFDPTAQKFVYLRWERDTPMPPTGGLHLERGHGRDDSPLQIPGGRNAAADHRLDQRAQSLSLYRRQESQGRAEDVF
jgi:hypothetical protein